MTLTITQPELSTHGFEPVRFSKGLYRGRQPRDEVEWISLAQMGLMTVVSLRLGEDDSWWEGHGQVEYRIPMGAILPPKESEVEQALAALRYAPKPVYLHCKDGVDRTGFVVARYRMRCEDWTREQAAMEMKAMGNHWWLSWWRLFL